MLTVRMDNKKSYESQPHGFFYSVLAKVSKNSILQIIIFLIKKGILENVKSICYNMPRQNEMNGLQESTKTP